MHVLHAEAQFGHFEIAEHPTARRGRGCGCSCLRNGAHAAKGNSRCRGGHAGQKGAATAIDVLRVVGHLKAPLTVFVRGCDQLPGVLRTKALPRSAVAKKLIPLTRQPSSVRVKLCS